MNSTMKSRKHPSRITERWQIVPILFITLCMFTPVSCQTKTKRDIIIDGLRCQNLINPEGVDMPLLSWEIITSREGVFQTAWEIEIASREDLLQKGKADVWRSAKATSLWETLPVDEITWNSAAEASRNHPMQPGFDVTFLGQKQVFVHHMEKW